MPIGHNHLTNDPFTLADNATLTTMSAKLPASVGQKATNASLPAVLSTEQEALLDSILDAIAPSDRFQSVITSDNATGAGVASNPSLAVASKRQVITCMVISTAAAMTVTISDADGNSAFSAIYAAPTGGAVIPLPRDGWVIAAANKNLKVTTSVVGDVSVALIGHYEAA